MSALVYKKGMPLSGNIGDYPDGIIIPVDKPYRWTSADVIRKIKWAACRHFGKKNLKVGHAGTLDPLATGVLLVCIGAATKSAERLQAGEKEYVAGVSFGATTPSFDLEKPIDRVCGLEGVTPEAVKEALKDFLGPQMQVAPLFSAKSVDGVRVYEKARRIYREAQNDGRPFDETIAGDIIKASPVVISELEMLDPEAGEVVGGEVSDRDCRINVASVEGYSLLRTALRIRCSKGTYIRALARDLGEALGTGAFLHSLRRTAVGEFEVGDAVLVGDAVGALSGVGGRFLNAQYVIDGCQKEISPAQMLGMVQGPAVKIVDESVGPGLQSIEYRSSDVGIYMDAVRGVPKRFPVAYAAHCSELAVAEALISSLWKDGHFSICNLELRPHWGWNDGKVGNMAAFYESVEAVSEFCDGLGVEVGGAAVSAAGECGLDVDVRLAGKSAPGAVDDEQLLEQPFKVGRPRMDEGRICAGFIDDAASWIIYVPFVNCEYGLGGSLLAQTQGDSGGLAPEVGDADYFQDCFEVVRELVEDGIVLSGGTVGAGGLGLCAASMSDGAPGIEMDISDLVRSCGCRNAVNALFAEVPGVIIQIRDSDFDYVDAELLLQDVAYYPLGHPSRDVPGVRVSAAGKSGIGNILDSLLRNQVGEGED